MRARWLAIVVAAVAIAGCSGGGDEPPAGPQRCDVRFTVPSGFEVTESLEDPYRDRIGVRMGFADDRGRELHYFAGIPGEIGEGLPSAGTVPVTTGADGVLLGQETTWVLAWTQRGPCAQHAVLGNGFSRKAFISTLGEAGVVPPGAS